MSILTISFSPVVLFCVRHSARLATLPLPLPFSRPEISSTPAARAPEPSRRSLPLYDHSREFGRAATPVRPLRRGSLASIRQQPSPSAPHNDLSEIGRASCRARVCKYVYISVVAVTL